MIDINLIGAGSDRGTNADDVGGVEFMSESLTQFQPSSHLHNALSKGTFFSTFKPP